MGMISYAQNFEDVILWRCLKELTFGFYIDLGANHPIHGSVTKWFYDNGWSGINVEPHPDLYEELSRARPRDINLQLAIDVESGHLDFYIVKPHGLSTLDAEIAAKYKNMGFEVRKQSVQSVTMDKLIALYANREVHFLKIDIEGREFSAIKAIKFSEFRPWIIIVECTKPMSTDPSFQDWEPLIVSANYTMCYTDGLNRFYLANERSNLKDNFQLPPNIFDDFVQYRQEIEDLQKQIEVITQLSASSKFSVGKLATKNLRYLLYLILRKKW